eukprot:4863403-Pyramimonas_sp.AAC.1
MPWLAPWATELNESSKNLKGAEISLITIAQDTRLRWMGTWSVDEMPARLDRVETDSAGLKWGE